VVPAGSSSHRFPGFASQSCPLSDKNSTYRPVHISGTGSLIEAGGLVFAIDQVGYVGLDQ
jgi:hypothetical protein